jgi:hypothetical protein
MDSTVTAVIVVALVAISFVVGFGLGRKGNVSLSEPDIRSLAQVVGIFVKAAEQMLAGAPGAEKLKWVIGEILKLPQFTDLDEADVRPLVEAAVFEVKQNVLLPELTAEATFDSLLDVSTAHGWRHGGNAAL